MKECRRHIAVPVGSAVYSPRKFLKRMVRFRALKGFLSTNFISFWDMFLAHLSTTCSRGAFRVVRGPSCIVNNFFKHLLLPNPWANLYQTWQECSLGGPLQKVFTEFDSIKNSGCHGNEIEFFKQIFKYLLWWNCRSDFEIISQKCSLGDSFDKLFTKFWSV